MAFNNLFNLTNGAREQYKARRVTQNRVVVDDIDHDRFSSFSSISSSFDERLSDAEFVRSFVPPPVVSPPPSPPPPPPPSVPPPMNSFNNGPRRPSRIPPPPMRRQINKSNSTSQNQNDDQNKIQHLNLEQQSQQDELHKSVLSAISGGIKLRHRSINTNVPNMKDDKNSPTSMQNILEKQILGNSPLSLFDSHS